MNDLFSSSREALWGKHYYYSYFINEKTSIWNNTSKAYIESEDYYQSIHLNKFTFPNTLLLSKPLYVIWYASWWIHNDLPNNSTHPILKGSFPGPQGFWFSIIFLSAILVGFKPIFTFQLLLHPRSILGVGTIVCLELQKFQQTQEGLYPFRKNGGNSGRKGSSRVEVGSIKWF